MFRSAGGTCRTAFGRLPATKSRPSGTISLHLHNFPGEAVEIMDFMRATARRKMLSRVSIKTLYFNINAIGVMLYSKVNGQRQHGCTPSLAVELLHGFTLVALK